MRIKILSSAIDDLHSGRLFYERQGEGLGEYFFDSIFADIDSLMLYAGIHQNSLRLSPTLIQTIPLCCILHAGARFDCGTAGS
jgi:hypothetical protein